MMLFHQPTMGLLDRFGRSPRVEAEHRQGRGSTPLRFITPALIRPAVIRTRAASTTAGLALLHLLLQPLHLRRTWIWRTSTPGRHPPLP